jgi:hypothetical protein
MGDVEWHFAPPWLTHRQLLISGNLLVIALWRFMVAVMTPNAARQLLGFVLAGLILWLALSYGLLALTCQRLTR